MTRQLKDALGRARMNAGLLRHYLKNRINVGKYTSKEEWIVAINSAARDDLALSPAAARPPGGAKTIPFIIVGLMRSGTTLVGDLVARHPDISWLDEGYPQCAYCPVLYLSALTRISPTICIGVKAFSYQLARRSDLSVEDYNRLDIDRARRILNRFRAKGWKFIYIKRNDIFAQAVSLTRARQTSEWRQISGGKKHNNRFLLDLVCFEQQLIFLVKSARFEQALLAAVDVLRFEYEVDLLNPESHQAAADCVFAYLGLRSAPVASDLVRTSVERLDVQLENYEEIARIAKNMGVTQLP